MRKPALIIFSIFLAVASCFPQDGKTGTGSIRGAVFTTNPSGAAVVISDAQIQIKGPVAKETRSDGDGNFLFEPLPAGKYEVTATALDLSDATDVTVIAGTTSVTSLDLVLEIVSSIAPCQYPPQSASYNFRFARRSRPCENQR